jgi:hypothetical protein
MADPGDGGASIESIAGRSRRSLADRAIAPYFREPALWPVAIVLIAHVILGIGVALLDALRSGMGYGLVALVLIGAGTAAALASDLRRRRLGIAAGALLACWVLGAAAAWAADRYGIY